METYRLAVRFTQLNAALLCWNVGGLQGGHGHTPEYGGIGGARLEGGQVPVMLWIEPCFLALALAVM